MCFSVCVFVFLISSVYVFDALFDFLLSTVFIFCLFSFCVCMFCFVFSSLYRSLNILFVCFAYNWMFLLALSHFYSPQQKCIFFCFVLWVIHVCVCLVVDGVFFYDPLRTRCCVHCLWFFFLLCLWCGCCLLILSHLNIWINVLDFFSLLFNDFFLLFCLECKSSRVFFSILFLSFRLFLSLSMLLLF